MNSIECEQELKNNPKLQELVRITRNASDADVLRLFVEIAKNSYNQGKEHANTDVDNSYDRGYDAGKNKEPYGF